MKVVIFYIYYDFYSNFKESNEYSSLDFDINCNADLQYKGRGIYTLNETKYFSRSNNYSVYSGDSRNSSLNMYFSFDYFKEVYEVNATSVKCIVLNIYAY